MAKWDYVSAYRLNTAIVERFLRDLFPRAQFADHPVNGAGELEFHIEWRAGNEYAIYVPRALTDDEKRALYALRPKAMNAW